VEGDTISTEPRAILQPERTAWPGLAVSIREYYAADLDLDGDDELIVAVPGTLIGQVRDLRPEIWIFEGGANFQLDTPTVVLKDDEENDRTFHISIGDLDGDSFPDFVVGGLYVGDGRPAELKFWWGNSRISDISRSPDRTIHLNDPYYPRIGNGLTLLDCDGDSVTDLWFPGPDGRYYLYRMGIEGKDPRTRGLSIFDADESYSMSGLGGISYRLGTMNDTSGRFDALGLTGPDQAGGGRMVVLSGGENGPNATYDGYYSASADGMTSGEIFGRGGPIGDATGNGYDDYLTGNPSWYGLDQGIVMLLEGGPYIPTDDPTVSVREEPIAGEAGGMSLWPNPVREELHVAWKGKLPKRPARLRIADMAGRTVAERDVAGFRGEAIWRCGGVASGTYLVTVLDRTGEPIAATTVVRS